MYVVCNCGYRSIRFTVESNSNSAVNGTSFTVCDDHFTFSAFVFIGSTWMSIKCKFGLIHFLFLVQWFNITITSSSPIQYLNRIVIFIQNKISWISLRTPNTTQLDRSGRPHSLPRGPLGPPLPQHNQSHVINSDREILQALFFSSSFPSPLLRQNKKRMFYIVKAFLPSDVMISPTASAKWCKNLSQVQCYSFIRLLPSMASKCDLYLVVKRDCPHLTTIILFLIWQAAGWASN